jgi:hypothetical protein
MMERERPGGKRIPEEWLGHPVQLVFVSGSSTDYVDGVLQEVNDRGIVLSADLHVGYPQRSLCSTRGARSSSSPSVRASARWREPSFREARREAGTEGNPLDRGSEPVGSQPGEPWTTATEGDRISVREAAREGSKGAVIQPHDREDGGRPHPASRRAGYTEMLSGHPGSEEFIEEYRGRRATSGLS